MISSVNEFERRLNALNTDDVSFVVLTDVLIAELDPSLHELVSDVIFRFFESHAHADCGAPGTLVHHVERFYPNYVNSLIQSVERKPSFNGVLMINRILNSDIDVTLRNRLMLALTHAASPNGSTAAVREMADLFAKRHSQRDGQ